MKEMALVVYNPPPRTSSRYANRPIFTIHSTPNQIFTIDMPIRTSVVAFRREKDAKLMAMMIEHHVLTTKSWPEISMNGASLRMFAGDIKGDEELAFLGIVKWNNINKLSEICKLTSMDLLDMITITNSGDRISCKWKLNELSNHIDIGMHAAFFDRLIRAEEA